MNTTFKNFVIPQEYLNDEEDTLFFVEEYVAVCNYTSELYLYTDMEKASDGEFVCKEYMDEYERMIEMNYDDERFGKAHYGLT